MSNFDQFQPFLINSTIIDIHFNRILINDQDIHLGFNASVELLEKYKRIFRINKTIKLNLGPMIIGDFQIIQIGSGQITLRRITS